MGLGEHHRDDFAISAPEVVLAAIAARTEHIRLGSAVTVLSSDDPIRVFERFSTLDAISGGRAEVTVGRGSFVESFPLFGFALEQYEELFEEKLDLFTHLLAGGPVTWSGTTRPPLTDQDVYPPIEQGRLRTWVGVGGSPQSVVRAARYGLPLMLAIIGGEPPTTVATKIIRSARVLGLDRFDLKISQGALAHEHTMRAIELYGTVVAPHVREALAHDAPTG